MLTEVERTETEVFAAAVFPNFMCLSVSLGFNAAEIP